MSHDLTSRLTLELDRLVHELTVEIPESLGEYRQPGEYAAITERQRWIQRRIRHLRRVLAELPRLSPGSVHRDRIGFGSEVRVEDLRSAEHLSYTVMAGDSIDLDAGEISVASPVGYALLGRRAGDEVEVATPQGRRRLRVLSVTTLFDGSGGGREAAPAIRLALDAAPSSA